MRHLTVRLRRPVSLIATAAAALALAGVAYHPAPAALAQPRYTTAERAYMAEMARILDVPEVLPEGSLAGGRNACYLIEVFGLDPHTLAGWEEHWHQPWERQWLEAAVRYIC